MSILSCLVKCSVQKRKVTSIYTDGMINYLGAVKVLTACPDLCCYIMSSDILFSDESEVVSDTEA